MALVATPRRAFADKQHRFNVPALEHGVDLMSPTPQQRKRSAQQGLSQSQTQFRPTASTARIPSTKRTRDDEVEDVFASKRCRVQHPQLTPEKRKSPTTTTTAPTKPSLESTTKELKRSKHSKAERIQREKQIENFVTKYTKAFPSFKFYFHGLEAGYQARLTRACVALGATVERFFNGAVTHVVSNRARPAPAVAEKLLNEKENVAVASGSSAQPSAATGVSSASLRSPIALRVNQKTLVPSETYDQVIVKALQLNMKLWETSKLEEIVNRLLQADKRSVVASTSKASSKAPVKAPLTLSHLLEAEKQAGITNERDPNAKRPDFDYFPKNSYYLLVQDFEEAYAPVVMKDYGRWNGTSKPNWPVLNLDGVGYSNKSKAPVFGWKPEMDDRNKDGNKPVAEVQRRRSQPNLRRAASMHNLGKKRTLLGLPPLESSSKATLDIDYDGKRSTFGASRPSIPSMASFASIASGLPSQGAYIAASGNSAMITSNLNSMTSATGVIRPDAPAALGKRLLQQQVFTNRAYGKLPAESVSKENLAPAATVDEDASGSLCPPPRPNVIKKSKSTNTLRLPPREETKKPGYCENCRSKFDDFAKHVRGGRHTKFANNPNHFVELDDTLARVRRRTLEERHYLEAGISVLSPSSSSEESDEESESESEEEEVVVGSGDEEEAEVDELDVESEDEMTGQQQWSEGSTAMADRTATTLYDDDEEDEIDELALREGTSEPPYFVESPDMEIGDIDDMDDL